MDEPEPTRRTLILRLQQGGDPQAWAEFVEIYTPVVYRLARRHGLQHADAADVTQEVFCTVARSVAGFHFNPGGGSFRGWLGAIVRSRLCDFHASRRRQVLGSGDSAIGERLACEPDRVSWDEACEREYRASLFQWAARQVRGQFTEKTWKAFWQTSVDGRAIREVAHALGMSEGAVYIARSRVLARLREKVGEVDI